MTNKSIIHQVTIEKYMYEICKKGITFRNHLPISICSDFL